jgi:transposase
MVTDAAQASVFVAPRSVRSRRASPLGSRRTSAAAFCKYALFFVKLWAVFRGLIPMSTVAPLSQPVCEHNVPLPTPEQLPNDLDTLKRMIIELMATLHAERRDKEDMKHRLKLLLDRLYGPRTERCNPDQLLLFAGWAAVGDADTGVATASSEESVAKQRPRKPKTPHGRGKLPDQLPRREVHHQLCEAERLCVCGQLRIDIGTDTSERVDWQPASLFVWQDIVHKYLCPDCAKKSAEASMTAAGQAPEDKTTTEAAADANAPPLAATLRPIGPAVISAPKPPSPLAKGLPGAGLLAYLIVSKYFDHLPLHRLEHILARQGLPLSRSTMCDWMAASAEVLRPLYDLMVSQVVQSAWLHTDDTPVKNQGHAPGTTALSRFWIYWGDRAHRYNVFDFTINRKRDGPQKFLADFHGYLHADAFSGYDALYLPSPPDAAAPIIEVACNAHARRKFYEARGSDDLRAHQALAYYAQLYALERGASDAGLDDEGRWRMRQDFSVPILERFHGWLTEQRAQVLPKSPMAEAIGYALNNWTALIRYTEAGFLSIDNNVAEREMKRIAIGRKNWLFVGSDKGGRTAAVLFSFTSTCHRLGIEPWAYLQDVLTRLPGLPAERLPELLPDRWQAARQAAAPASAAPSADSLSTPRSHP